MSGARAQPTLVSGTNVLQASQVVTTEAANVEELICTNTSGAVVYCQAFNSATVPADATQPDLVFAVPATATASLDLQQGVNFSAGVSVCVSTTAHTKTIATAIAVFNTVIEQR